MTVTDPTDPTPTDPTDPQDATNRSFEERFASLEESSRALAANVLALTQSLALLRELQIELAAQRARQDDAARALVDAKEEADARDDRTRRVINIGGAALFVVLSLVAVLVYSATLNHVEDLLSDQKAGFYNSCMTRNMATQANIERELLLAEADKDADVKKIHRDSARDLAKGLPDCNQYKR